MKVFYSWQSDIERKYNRNFIKQCLESAIKLLSQELNIKDALRLDHDTKDVKGSPDIVATILEKIEESDIFIGDITFTAKSSSNFKYSPNPNVLIELGYAMKALGTERVINVMNTAFGKPEGNLPFDLAHKRWPIQYELSSDNYSEKAGIKKLLIASIKSALYPFINMPKSSIPAFASKADQVKHREKLRKEFDEELMKIRANKLRRDVIIRDIDRVDGYPNTDEDHGISSLFRIAILNTYTRGVRVGLSIDGLTEYEDGYRYTDYKNKEESDISAYLVGEIPFDSIVTVNWDGDEYYYFPHIYCYFNDNGEPYERLMFCEKVDMGDGIDYYKEISDYESVRTNSKKAKTEKSA